MTGARGRPADLRLLFLLLASAPATSGHANSSVAAAEDRVALATFWPGAREAETPGAGDFAGAPAYDVAGARFQLLWDEDALWVQAAVEDDMLTATRREHDEFGTWLDDAIEVVIDRVPGQPDRASPTIQHVIVSAAGGVYDAETFAEPPDVTAEFASARVDRTGADFSVLVRIDLASAGVTERDGAVLGLNLMMDDADGTAYTSTDWMRLDGFSDSMCYGRLVLVGSGDPSACVDGFDRDGGRCVDQGGCAIAPASPGPHPTTAPLLALLVMAAARLRRARCRPAGSRPR